MKRLRADGWVLNHAKGSHHQYKHPFKPGKVTAPHPNKDKSSDYGVTVPDLLDCFSSGYTLEDAIT